MDASGPQATHPVRCPRCGYDLSGITPTWSTSCPLLGVCSECGLESAWGDVLNPALTIPPWLFENEGVPGPHLVRAWLGTVGRALRPPRFWRQVRMVHPISARRLIWLAVWLCALVYVITAVTVFGRHIYDLRWTGAGWGATWDFSVRNMVGGGWRAITWPRFVRRPIYGFPVMVWIVTPLGFLALSTSMRMARVRWAHVWRAAVHGLSGLVAWTLCMLFVDLSLYVAFVVSSTWGYLEMRNEVKLVWLLGCVLWTIVWWAAATARYMKLHLWWAVTASLMALSLMASFVVLAYRELY